MARVGSVVVSLAALAAICAAAALAFRMSPVAWRNLVVSLSRLLRHEAAHPRWDVLAQ
jgi:hypothetical protein